MSEIMVSVLVPTYNQENYIAQALDGVLRQKTQYTYEVLVGEDLSTDGTREVLRQYETAHPGRVTVYYREHNLGRSADVLDNHMDLYHRAKGKYVIFLEGDDFWLDDEKMEKQVNFLEQHPDYIATAHNCVVVDERGEKREERYPECKDEEYTLSHYKRNILPGQLATLMMRNIYQIPDFRTDMWEKRLVPGDRLFYFTLLSCGKIYCRQEAMTAYRYVTSGGSSYTANVRYDFLGDEYWHRALYTFALDTGKKEFRDCAGVLYLTALVRGLKTRAISLRQATAYIAGLGGRGRLLAQFFYIYVPIYAEKIFYRLFHIDAKKI
ncbi:MAG: glycosyltransferase family 2 protein [Schwartzia sp. (in: firmicutes)]